MDNSELLLFKDEVSRPISVRHLGHYLEGRGRALRKQLTLAINDSLIVSIIDKFDKRKTSTTELRNALFNEEYAAACEDIIKESVRPIVKKLELLGDNTEIDTIAAARVLALLKVDYIDETALAVNECRYKLNDLLLLIDAEKYPDAREALNSIIVSALMTFKIEESQLEFEYFVRSSTSARTERLNNMRSSHDIREWSKVLRGDYDTYKAVVIHNEQLIRSKTFALMQTITGENQINDICLELLEHISNQACEDLQELANIAFIDNDSKALAIHSTIPAACEAATRNTSTINNLHDLVTNTVEELQ